MSNDETIAKLSNMLTALIEKYEKLQAQNAELNNKVEKLTLDKNSLENEKATLMDDLEKYNNTSKQQGTNINSMLGKIESLLGSNTDIMNGYTSDSYSNTSSTATTLNNEENNSNNVNTKLDLDRMSNLLDGFK